MSFGKIAATLAEMGHHHHGFARLRAPLTMDYYRAWLARGDHADMQFMADQADYKADPRAWSPRARTAIVIAKSYLPHPYPRATRPRGLRVAQYARGSDYHHRFLSELRGVAECLGRKIIGEEFLCYTDSAPILERDLAARAGIGWVGKNTCVLDRSRGSMFWIGQILTTLAYEGDDQSPADFCGTCTRCLDACPTGALESPRRLNARKCISYWTIEGRAAPPLVLREKFSDWFFGCDICQTVCPWNVRAHGTDVLARLAERPARASSVDDLRWVLSATHRGLLRGVAHTPLTRARPAQLKRNALLVIGNEQLVELRPEVEAALAVDELKEVARWTLERLTSTDPHE